PGRTVIYTDPVLANPVDNTASIKELVNDVRAGKVEVLIMLGGNPVFDTPMDADLSTLLPKVPVRIHHGLYSNETSAYSNWHINSTHYLEEWGDTRAVNGMASVVQPLIAPLYAGRSAIELLTVFLGQPAMQGYEIVRQYWQTQHKGDDFEEF